MTGGFSFVPIVYTARADTCVGSRLCQGYVKSCVISSRVPTFSNPIVDVLSVASLLATTVLRVAPVGLLIFWLFTNFVLL